MVWSRFASLSLLLILSTGRSAITASYRTQYSRWPSSRSTYRIFPVAEKSTSQRRITASTQSMPSSTSRACEKPSRVYFTLYPQKRREPYSHSWVVNPTPHRGIRVVTAWLTPSPRFCDMPGLPVRHPPTTYYFMVSGSRCQHALLRSPRAAAETERGARYVAGQSYVTWEIATQNNNQPGPNCFPAPLSNVRFIFYNGSTTASSSHACLSFATCNRRKMSP